MSEIPPIAVDAHRRAVRAWLLTVAALVFVTLVVGGATRLTESGLSIVEWKPVTGVLPPLAEPEWQAELEKYRATTQYQQINRGMSLQDFKTIYWWEWSHRMLGRLLGVVFLLPLLFFLARGWIERKIHVRLWIIFALGALQGAVGWWMVASGLVGRVSVSQYRLAFHLTLACVIYAALVWTAQQVMPRPPTVATGRLRGAALLLALLTLGQIYLGALVAGLDAGLSYNTWPLIDGAFIPAAERLLLMAPAWVNAFENPLTVQFDHRMAAYAMWLLAMFHALDAIRSDADIRTKRDALALAGLVTLQAAMGILTVIYVAPIGLALAHQMLAIVVLTAVILHAERLRHRSEPRLTAS